MARRVDIRAILDHPGNRRKLLVNALIALQRREGIEITHRQAEEAYDKVQLQRSIRRIEEERDGK